MIEELQRRNFAETTIRSYVRGVEHFTQYFHRRPHQLGPEPIRQYQAMLFSKLKHNPNTVILRLASLRFFYIHVLKRSWSIAETSSTRISIASWPPADWLWTMTAGSVLPPASSSPSTCSAVSSAASSSPA